MEIPRSAIEPFGIVGMPNVRSVITQMSDKLKTTFEWFRASFVNDHISANELCWILAQKAIQYGAYDAECKHETLQNGSGVVQMHAFFLDIYMRNGTSYEMDFHIKLSNPTRSSVWSFP